MESFHCAEPPERQTEFVKLLASLTTYDVFFGHNKDKDSTEVGRFGVFFEDAISNFY